jgi:hypothetical protein
MTSRGKNAQDVADAVHSLADAAAQQYADYIDSGAVDFVKPDITPEHTQQKGPMT